MFGRDALATQALVGNPSSCIKASDLVPLMVQYMRDPPLPIGAGSEGDAETLIASPHELPLFLRLGVLGFWGFGVLGFWGLLWDRISLWSGWDRSLSGRSQDTDVLLLQTLVSVAKPEPRARGRRFPRTRSMEFTRETGREENGLNKNRTTPLFQVPYG